MGDARAAGHRAAPEDVPVSTSGPDLPVPGDGTGGRSFLGATHLSRTNIVAYEDFTRSLARVGFTGSEIWLLDAWLTATEFDTAAEALRRIRQLGLRDRMPKVDRDAALELVRPHQPAR